MDARRIAEPTEIRRIEPADAATWHALRKRAVREHPDAFLTSFAEEQSTPLEAVAARLAVPIEDVFVLGAFLSETLVGTLGVYRQTHEKGRYRALVWGVYVADEARRRGVARALFEAAIDLSRRLGVERLTLAVKTDNTPARSLYVALGFVTWGIERDAFRVDGVPIDEEHMDLVLR